ncbi:MAG: hypothetical protein CMC56_03800 [Flavobacteriaceae bacterium]|nr:hypothetical protein [Flavobacteriaceae bacterium]|tara:strand:- start:585 stop:1130 length:546 start_codon:yes stop_codon:yes gene_type:complete
MKIHFLNTPLSAFICLLLLACNSESTLQSYFVDHQESAAFISVDLPISFLKIDSKEINQSQTNAIESIDKLNMLGYSIKSGQKEVYSAEVAVLTKLLQDEKYNELISFGNSKEGRVRIYYIGDDSSIDEFVVFTTSIDIGFAVIRVLGNEMNLSEIMQLGPIIDKLDTESLNVDDFFDFML